MSTIVKNIKDILAKKNITKYKMLKDCEMSQAMLNNWETRTGRISIDHVATIADYLGVSIDELYGHKMSQKAQNVTTSPLLNRIAESDELVGRKTQEQNGISLQNTDLLHEILQHWDELDEEQCARLVGYMQGLLKTDIKKEREIK